MKHVLINTDVFMDFFTNRKPFSENAIEILSMSEKGLIKTYLTPVIVSNLYYLLRRTGASHKKVVGHLRMLFQNVITDVIQIDKSCILEALNSDFNDFEDALQNYASSRNSMIDIIITRNVRDYKKSSLVVLMPNEFLASL